MRRFLLFLVVFGAGLALLIWLDRRGQESPQRATPDGGVPQESAPTADAQEPAQPPASDDDQTPPDGVEVTLKRRFDATYNDEQTGLKRYTLAIEELVPIEGSGGEYDALGVRFDSFEAFDPEQAAGIEAPPSGVLLSSSMTADRGRLRLTIEPELSLGDEGRIRLFDATLTQERGGALSPLVFESPELLLFVDDERFESVGQHEVNVRGQGLEATGRGLVVEGGAARFRFERGGRVRFQSGDNPAISLANTPAETADPGRLRVERVGGTAGERLEAEASGGARLDVEDQEAAWVQAETLALFGRFEASERESETGDESERLVLESGSATGAVQAERGRDRALGGRAELHFVAQGKLSRVELHQQPSIDLAVSAKADQELYVHAEGRGPLEVDLTGPTRFGLNGPGRLQTPDLAEAPTSEPSSIVFEERLDGWFVPAQEPTEETSAVHAHGEFEARGTVVVSHGDYRLETESVHASIPGELEDAYDLRVPDFARLTGPDASGRPLSFEAERGLTVLARGEDWHVPEAVGVNYRVELPGGASLEAGRVLELVWSQRRFRVEGGFILREERGVLRGERAEARGIDDVEAFGARDAQGSLTPVTLELSDALGRGLLRGERVHMREQVLVAEGEAHADFRGEVQGQEQGAEIDAQQLQLTLSPPGEPLPDGQEQPQPFQLEAQQVTRAYLARPNDSTELACRKLTIEGVLIPDSDPEAVPAEGQDESSRPARTARLGQLVAEQEVRVDHRGRARIDGAGDRFVLEGDKARLEANAGQRVTAWGRVEEGDLPYELTAEWIENRGTRFEAHRPHFVVNAVLLPISPIEPLGLSADGTQVRAEHVLLDRTGALWTGDVVVTGRDRSGLDLRLDTQRLKLGGRMQELRPGRPWLRAFDWVEAHGGFTMRYAGDGTAHGEHLFVTKGQALFEGQPAQAKVAGFSVESNTIDLNLETFLARTDRGVVRTTGLDGAWSLEFASMTPVEDNEETMVILGNPRYRGPRGEEVHAEWMTLWVHAKSWSERGRQELFGEETTAGLENVVTPPLPQRDLLPNIFRRFEDKKVVRFARAVYLEGEVESIENGRRAARADAFYLDLVESQGWVRGADFSFLLEVGSTRRRVKVATGELKTAADGSLRAEKATITTCDHDDPHYVMETGDLTLEPRERGGWRLSARSNMLRLQNGLQLPLPPRWAMPYSTRTVTSRVLRPPKETSTASRVWPSPTPRASGPRSVPESSPTSGRLARRSVVPFRGACVRR